VIESLILAGTIAVLAAGALGALASVRGLLRPPPRQPDGSLSSCLPYFTFSEGVFVHKDRSIGRIWELTPREAETLPTEALGQASLYIENVINALPEEGQDEAVALQVIQVCQAGPSPRTSEWLQATDPGAAQLVKDLAGARAEVVSQGRIEDADRIFASRSVRVFLTLRVFPSQRAWGLWDAFKASLFKENHVLAELQATNAGQRARLQSIAQAIQNALRMAKVGARELAADESVALIFEMLNPDSARSSASRPALSPDAPISETVSRAPLAFAPQSGTIALENSKFAVLSMDQPPPVTRAGELWRDSLASPLGSAEDLTTVFNVWIPEQASLHRSIAALKYFAHKNRVSVNTGVNAEAEALSEDIEDLQREMTREGRKSAKVQVSFIVRAASEEELARRCTALSARLRTASVELLREDAYALDLFLQSLPMGFCPATIKGMVRARTPTTLNVAHLLPLVSPMRGSCRPNLLLQNRLGEPVYFDPFETEGGAAHELILGGSGGGKSFLTAAKIVSALRTGARVFVIDKGAGDAPGSYAKLCRMVGGLYVKLDPKNVRSLNPFGAVENFEDFNLALDPERRLILTGLLGQMATRGKRDLEDWESTLLERSVERVYRDRFTRRSSDPILVSDVRKSLQQQAASGQKQAESLALLLEKWTGSNSYGAYFDRPCQLDMNRLPPLVVFEIWDRAGWNEVAPTLLMSVLNLIERVFSREKTRDKYLVLDEAWRLLASRDTAEFFVNVAKTYRKLHAALVVVTQQLDDLKGDMGEMIRKETKTRIFLQQSAETVREIAELLELSEGEKSGLQSLRKVDGLYSEALVVSPSTRGVAVLAPSSLEYWAFTTKPEDNQILESLQKELKDSGDPDPARSSIQLAARRHPKGCLAKREAAK
jgi:type-IV secretion system protein TraC